MMPRISITRHAIDRYLDGVVDSDKAYRSESEIRRIIREGFSNAQLPKRISEIENYLVELKDPTTHSSFGMYYLVLKKSQMPDFDFAVVTIKPLDFLPTS